MIRVKEKKYTNKQISYSIKGRYLELQKSFVDDNDSNPTERMTAKILQRSTVLQKQETIQYMHQGYAQTLFTNNYNFDFNIVLLHNYCYRS